jgi:predicted phosphate transport protein (TIGR00153 family)
VLNAAREILLGSRVPKENSHRDEPPKMRLIPRETKFFDLFAELSGNLTEGAKLLRAILEDPRDLAVRVQQVQAIEHKGDRATHAIITKLNQTFITPFDREDIHRLASSLDDVLDYVNSAAVRLVMYKISAPPPVAAELAGLIVLQCEELAHGVSLLEKNGHVMDHCAEVNRLEDQADHVSRRAIADLFEHERDPIQLIKLKELYEVLEFATDKAEDAANVLEAIVVKSA